MERTARAGEPRPPPMGPAEAVAAEAARPDADDCALPSLRRAAAPPEFAGVMPRINGPDVCLVPFSAAMLDALKAQPFRDAP